METPIITATGYEETVGKRLQQLAKEKDFDSLGNVLNKVHVPEGFKLAIHAVSEQEECGMGAESYTMLVAPDGETISDKDKEFWKMLKVEDSPEGAWQVYLLHNLWHYLPMFWHAFYEERHYVYSIDQLKMTLRYQPHFGDEVVPAFDVDQFEIHPVINRVGNIWHVGAHFWSDFEGLVYEELKISLSGKVHIYSRPASRKILHHYDCGICF